MINKKRILFFPIILIIGILFLIINDMGIFRWHQLNKERDFIKNEINSLIVDESNLKKELDRLQYDNDYIKKIAQEKYHMVKPGEKVFRVINK